MRPVIPPVDGDDWLGLTDAELPVGELYEWCVRPDCGAVVLFSGTVRDHAEGRPARRWPLRFLIRRTAQHALDHAWELEDRNPG